MKTSSAIVSIIIFAVIGGLVGYTMAPKAGTPQDGRQQDAQQNSIGEGNISQKKLDLREKMRKILSDHIMSARAYSAAVIDSHPSASTIANRLMENEEDIGALFSDYYGMETGRQLTDLLKEHIRIEDQFVQAFKVNNQANITAAKNKWEANKKALVNLLVGANSNWSQAELASALEEHMTLLGETAQARINKQWQKEIENVDKTYGQILTVGDVIVDGIVKQFPDKF